MVITGIHKNKKGLFDVYIGGEYCASVSGEDIAILSLKEGKEADFEDVKAAAQELCARREGLKLVLTNKYTKAQLAQKLMQKGIEQGAAEDAALHFEENGYIDEKALIKRCLSDAVNLNKYGENRIAQMLMQKGFAQKDVEEAICEKADDIDKNLEVFVSSYGPITPENARSLVNKLLVKGYTLEKITELVNLQKE
jgi:SOS response regulatory protein OraA/RecX